MIELYGMTPTLIWMEMGKLFFGVDYETMIDIKLGDRRFVSLQNIIGVKNWSRDWEGKALFELVGYSSKGYKMDVLRKTYVDEKKWKEFKCLIKQKTKKGFAARGMQFNMSLERKGGCLSSLHLIQNRGKNHLFVHGKIAEVPRKFMADLLLIKTLLEELELWPMEVTFMYSVVYFSIVGLRAYVPVLGRDKVDLHDLPILTPRNYQASIIEAITNKGKELEKKYGKGGLWKQIDLETGNWKN